MNIGGIEMIYAVHKKTKEHRPVPGFDVLSNADWRYIQATPDGWIEHDGSERPLPADARCDVQFSGGLVNDAKATQPVWSLVKSYRPILDADTKPEPPAWDGEGLPPAGCEREWLIHEEWIVATVIGCTRDKDVAALEDRAVEALVPVMREAHRPFGEKKQARDVCRAIYHAIRDGKVPGVKLTGGE